MKLSKFLFVFMIAILIIITSGCTSKEWALTTSVTPNGGGTINPSGGTYKNGAEIIIVATSAKYYKFNGWAGDISDSTDRVTIKMNSNKNVVASFVKIMYSLQLNANPPNSGTLDPKSGNYEAGSQVKITATPATGYRFDHWGDSATGTANQVSILMDTDKTITAYFTRQYTLRVVSDPNDGGTVNIGDGVVYDAGTQVKLSATQVFPYAFSGWTGTDSDAVNPTTVTMSTDKTITCNFKKLTPSEWIEEHAYIYRGGDGSVSIELKQYEYVEGNIHWNYIANIQDPAGATIKNFGSATGTQNFLITAQSPGRYTIIMHNTDQLALQTDYTIKYRIYKR
jgi:hypothetical protein